ncbi:MAG: DUF2808 domain-containing protein [Aphanocapsa lilacina HA4352-LM1]|jgi:hypothetical protein|nr:DUF2808 domain-containing protein [Aphanocapsa lilacina HA4352-LM1]
MQSKWWRTLFALILACQATPVLAQGGFVLFGGERDANNNLSYSMINNRSKVRFNMLDLMFRPQNVAIAELQLTYPHPYDNSFDLNNIQVLNDLTKQAFEVEKIEQDQLDSQARVMTIILKQPIPAETPLRIRMQNFTNPRAGGTYKILARYLGTEPNPLYRFAGSWFISFN